MGLRVSERAEGKELGISGKESYTRVRSRYLQQFLPSYLLFALPSAV